MSGALKQTLLVLYAIGVATAARASATVTSSERNATSHDAIYDNIRRYLARRREVRVRIGVHSLNVPRVGAARTISSNSVRLAEERPAQAEETKQETQGLDCSLVPTPVPVPPSATAITYPEYVVVNRCAGGCLSYGRGCAANTTMTKRIAVRRFPFSQDPNYLEDVDIEEHTSCRCACLVKSSQCSPDVHNYDESECRCDCRARIQSCTRGKRWSHDTCSCACSNVTSCQRGQEFSHATCSCISVCK